MSLKGWQKVSQSNLAPAQDSRHILLYCYRVKQLLLHWKCLDICSEIRGRSSSLCLGGKSVLVGQIQPVAACVVLVISETHYPI